MATVRGKVEFMSNKYGKFSIKVGDNWYSSKFEIPCKKGDMVEFDDGDNKYCRKLKVVDGGSGGGSSASSGGGSNYDAFEAKKQRSITRQTSLARAVEILPHLKLDAKREPDDVVKLVCEMAEDFFNFVVEDPQEKADKEADKMFAEGFNPEE